MEELETLFGGILATGSQNWSSEGEVASAAEESLTHTTSMPSETPINLEENGDLQTNDEEQGFKKKSKKGKKVQTHEEMNKNN